MPKPELHVHVERDPLFEENGYVLYLRHGGECWLVDPGLPPHAKRMCDFVERNALTTTAILLTHAHGDHIAGTDDVRARLGAVPVYLGRPEWEFLSDPALNLSADFGFEVVLSTENLRDLSPGLQLPLEGTTWLVLDTSGHSPGGRSLYCDPLGVVVVGDALFRGSIGRYDFPHSDGARLLRNIRDNLLTLPADTRVLCGHGPETTIGIEARDNPHLSGAA